MSCKVYISSLESDPPLDITIWLNENSLTYPTESEISNGNTELMTGQKELIKDLSYYNGKCKFFKGNGQALSTTQACDKNYM